MLQFNTPKLNQLLEFTFTKMKIQNAFGRIVNEAIEYREKHNIVQNDILNLMIALKKDKSQNSPQKNEDCKHGTNDLSKELLYLYSQILISKRLPNIYAKNIHNFRNYQRIIGSPSIYILFCRFGKFFHKPMLRAPGTIIK